MLVAAAAACVATLLVIGAALPSGFQGSDLEKEVIAAHVRSLLADHLLDVPSAEPNTVRGWFTGKVDFSPEVATPAGFELSGGRLEYLNNRPAAALVYRRGGHTVNVFLWPAGSGDVAPETDSLQGFRVLHWVRGGLNWWVVSDATEGDLRLLAK